MTKAALLDYDALPHEAYALAPEKQLAGSGAQAVRNHFSDPSGQFHIGFWQAEPGKWTVSYSEFEYCEILEGVIVMTDADGHALTVRKGDRFSIEAGYTGTWEVLESARKVYVIFEPKT